MEKAKDIKRESIICIRIAYTANKRVYTYLILIEQLMTQIRDGAGIVQHSESILAHTALEVAMLAQCVYKALA